MTADRPLLGILLMTGFCILAPLGDSLSKIVIAEHALILIITARFIVQPVLLTPILWAQGGGFAMPRRALWLTALRTVLHIIGIACMVLSLRYLPLADAIAIAFVMPFLMLILGNLVLGEEVGPRRLAACAVGFVGTLLVVQPSFAEVGAPALLPLVVAVAFSLFMLVTRIMAKDTGAIQLQAVSGAMATVVLVPLLLLFDGSGLRDLDADMPDGRTFALLLGLGIIGTVGHLMMTWSLRFAPAATLAPMQYLEIPFATAIGFALFGDLPNGLAAAGIAITVASGLYIVARERSLSRVPTPPAPAPQPKGMTGEG
ncbi:DMT family transporter [Anianabacter salinae]|uniref:DMT family transporter n=1 Tax=Anianabacter salinae TaxID=2851023 RepID=UPI00225E613C|nr:DMT family transporter [Anianabacter salinae]MBV0911260.1 DMT family transporter [Anianabacter salinae]